MSTDPQTSTFVTQKGESVNMQDWLLPPGTAQRGAVILVHGLGEHMGRYAHVAQKLRSWGFSVRAYDQCGHGKSNYAQGGLSSDNRMLDDLADVVSDTRSRLAQGLPLLLLGHSMGGVVVMRYASLKPHSVEGIVVSSPALIPRLRAWQKLLVAVFYPLLPNFRAKSGLSSRYVSRNPVTVQAYQQDPLVHPYSSVRLAKFVLRSAASVLALAPRWPVPSLLMYAGADRIVDPAGSRHFGQSAPKDRVTTDCFDAMYHEIFNEPDAETVFASLKDWLDQRF